MIIWISCFCKFCMRIDINNLGAVRAPINKDPLYSENENILHR